MVTLKFYLDQLLAEVPGGIGRYTENLAREVIKRAPAGCEVTGLVSQISLDDQRRLLDRFPGLVDLDVAKFSRKSLSKFWQHGLFTGVFDGGLMHAPSLFAPIRHPESGESRQLVVTVHDTVPWSHPETLTPNGVRWHKAQLKRAWQYADAVVTPTHAVAEQIGNLYDFGDRIRVIPGAGSPDVRIPVDEQRRTEIAQRLRLPDTYILAAGTLEPRKNLGQLIRALAEPQLRDAVLLHAGPEGWGDVSLASLCADAGVDPRRVRGLGFLSNEELAVAMHGATVFCMPSIDEGFGLPIIESFNVGTPVVCTDIPAFDEISQGAALQVRLDPADTFVHRLAIALSNVLHDLELQQTLTTAGYDRAPVYSWTHSADLVWRLHADL